MGDNEQIDPALESAPPGCGDPAESTDEETLLVCVAPEEEQDGCGDPAESTDEETLPLCVAPEEEQEVVVAADPSVEVRAWPRRVCARKIRGITKLFLYFPSARQSPRFVELTRDKFEEYLAALGETRAGESVSTWGAKETLTLDVSRIITVGNAHRLVFDPRATDAPRYEFDVYNLGSSQPGWRRTLERTLMALPIGLLQALRFRSVFLDFRVGTNRIGPKAAVGDGGTNWKLDRDENGPRGIDPEGCSAVCVSYAALNRAWHRREWDEGRFPTEEAIDTAFNGRALVISTVYHEFGHLVHFGGLARGRPNSLWERYRKAINYVHGMSRGPGEGFAEAFRQRFSGDAFQEGAIRDEMDEAFAAIGLPTLESVRIAREAIAAHVEHPG